MPSTDNDLLSRFSVFIASRLALHFPRERWSDLEKKAVPAAREFGYEDVASFIRWLTTSAVSREQIEILASHLTISETYFWREPQVFDALVEHILPGLVRSREGGGRLLRIWSAGCSTGEEPYSIAIALQRAVPDLKRWNVTILATDINPRILRMARTGIYGEWSFRNAPPWLRAGYFRARDDGKMEILPGTGKMVSFSYLNLAEDIYPSPVNNTGAMDIIFCRNVLMYFAPDRAREVVRGLYRSLSDGGWLIVSSSELSQGLFPEFSAVNFSGAIVYRKETAESRPSGIPGFTDAPFPEHFTLAIPDIALPPDQPSLTHMFSDPGATGDAVLHPGGVAPYAGAADPATGEDLRKETGEADDGETRPSPAGTIRALADGGKLAEALAVCDAAIAGNRLNPGLHYLRAVILQEENRYDEAAVSLRSALYLDPDHALAHFTLGNLALRRGDAATAKKSFDNALALLSDCRQEDVLPESEGMTAGRFREIIRATITMGALS